MTRKQLNYIKEKQAENIFVLPTIKNRTDVDNSIFEELETIYNPDLLGMETEFKQSLNDVSLPNDFMEDTRMLEVIRKYGADTILVYLYLHTKMCKEGYRIVWNDMQKDVMCAMLAGVYKVPFERINDIIGNLLKNKLLFILNDGTEQWITSAYQIYMYERVCAKRVRDRIYKKNQSLKKEDKIKIETSVPVFSEEPKTTADFGSVSDDVFMNNDGEQF